MNQRKSHALIVTAAHLVDIARRYERPDGIVREQDRWLDLVSASPLHVARMPLDASHVLPNLALDRFEEELVDGVCRIREPKFRPDEDAELITGRVEVISTGECIGRLIDASSPNAQLPKQDWLSTT